MIDAFEGGDGRQSRANKYKGQLLLLEAMHGHDQGRELSLSEILNLVDKEGHSRVPIFRRFTDGDEQRREVGFEVSAIGRAHFRIVGQAKRHVADRHLWHAYPATKNSEGTLNLVAYAMNAIEIEQEFFEGRSEHIAQAPLFRSFDKHLAKRRFDGEPLDLVKEDGLAHTSQASHDQAFFGTAGLDPAQEDMRLLKNFGAANQLGRRRTHSGGNGFET